MAEQIRFIDVPHEQFADALRSVDQVWYPTTGDEPYGLVPLEAIACGIPVVVSDSGGMTETIGANEAGRVVPRNDPRALTEAAYRLHTDPALRDTMIGAGLSYVDRLGLDPYVSRLIDIYQQLN